MKQAFNDGDRGLTLYTWGTLPVWVYPEIKRGSNSAYTGNTADSGVKGFILQV